MEINPKETAIVLIDHQVRTMGWVRSIDKKEMEKNAAALAKVAVALDMPLVLTGLIVAFTVTFFTIQSYGTTMRESVFEIQFEKDVVTVFIADQTMFGRGFTELTAVPIDSLVEAHDRLPKTSMNDCIVAGTIGTETKKAGTYITQNNDREFWYTIRGSQDQIITIELQDHEFDRIVFVSENSKEWIKQINDNVNSTEQVRN